MASVREFLESLNKPVEELPDVENIDYAGDSVANWSRLPRNVEELEIKEDIIPRRNLHVAQDLQESRYAGKPVSAKEIFGDDEISGLAQPSLSKKFDNLEIDSEDTVVDDEESSQEDAHSGSSESGDDDEESNGREEDNEDYVDKVTVVTDDMQKRKGESIKRQICIWDRLMHLHILAHACLKVYNQLPREQLAKDLIHDANEETVKQYKHARNSMRKTIEIFNRMESLFLESSKAVKSFKNNDSDDNEIESSEDEEKESTTGEEGSAHVIHKEIFQNCQSLGQIQEDDSKDEDIFSENKHTRHSSFLGKRKSSTMIAGALGKKHEDFEPFRKATLMKWDDRTRLIVSGTKSKSDFSAFEFSVLKNIEKVMSDKHRLLRRTQNKRSDNDRIGSNRENDFDLEIFDDDDFYQQLLKDLIERKTADVVDPTEMSRQWLEIQNLRQKRTKRKKVDTKASKGRKIRYTVIPRLVNYFPSVPECVSWNNEARNQLFKSLFSS